jgi:nitrate reductase gamma subunit
MSPFLKILENEVQLAALSVMAVVYLTRTAWIMRFRGRKEVTFPAGSELLGEVTSLMNIAMPWAMESTRKNPFFYLQFVFFHIGVAFAIGLSFVIPYAPRLLENPGWVLAFRIITGTAFIVGLLRLYRRLTKPAIRIVSTPDDYFSLSMMIVYFGLAFWAAPNTVQESELPLIVFFLLTTFLLVYVPFSKIGHYLYYPFTRYFLGKTLGHRGAISKGSVLRGMKHLIPGKAGR